MCAFERSEKGMEFLMTNEQLFEKISKKRQKSIGETIDTTTKADGTAYTKNNVPAS